MRARHLKTLAWSSISILIACSAALPQPRFVRQQTSALIEVDYPPPPARVEVVPPRPSAEAVWIDGEWTWTGSRWAWKYGSWVVPPAGAAYSPWTTVRSSDATLYFAPGVWRDARGVPLPAPIPLAIAKASHDDVIGSEGEVEKTGRNVRPEGAPRTPRRRPSSSAERVPTLDPAFFGDAGLPRDAGLAADAAPGPDAAPHSDAEPPPPEAGEGTDP